MKSRKITTYTGLLLTGAVLVGCAGTAPNAVQKGYPAASLDATKRIICSEAEDVDKCVRDRDLNAVDPLADHGFHEAKTHEAREARRNEKRARREARGD